MNSSYKLAGMQLLTSVGPSIYYVIAFFGWGSQKMAIFAYFKYALYSIFVCGYCFLITKIQVFQVLMSNCSFIMFENFQKFKLRNNGKNTKVNFSSVSLFHQTN